MSLSVIVNTKKKLPLFCGGGGGVGGKKKKFYKSEKRSKMLCCKKVLFSWPQIFYPKLFLFFTTFCHSIFRFFTIFCLFFRHCCPPPHPHPHRTPPPFITRSYTPLIFHQQFFIFNYFLGDTKLFSITKKKWKIRRKATKH